VNGVSHQNPLTLRISKGSARQDLLQFVSNGISWGFGVLSMIRLANRVLQIPGHIHQSLQLKFHLSSYKREPSMISKAHSTPAQ
jgi:hypothetical protein